MLEPRRLATRAAARRMADLTGTTSASSSATRPATSGASDRRPAIEVVTEGILTRRLQHDPELPGVGLVVFDEVHERNLTTDLGLALTLDAARRCARTCASLAMSATADTAMFARLLGGATAGTDRRERRAHPSRSTCAGGPRTRDDRLEPAVAVGRAGGRCATSPATCSCSCPASARSAARPLISSPSASDVDVHRWPARSRWTSRTARSPRRRPVAGGWCWPPTSPRRRSRSRACASSSTAGWPERRASTSAPA